MCGAPLSPGSREIHDIILDLVDSARYQARLPPVYTVSAGMVLERSSRTQAAAPSGSQQQGKAEEIERRATTSDPPPSTAAGVDEEFHQQELSPPSPPEGLGEQGACERDKEWFGPGEVDADGPKKVSPHCSGGAAPGTQNHIDKATRIATAAVDDKGMKQSKEEAEGTEGLPHGQMSVVALKGRGGLPGGNVEATATSEQHTKQARDQAKRLALEVARLRSSLRTTTSELNTERSTRVRIEVKEQTS